jgi:hypothetical protein
MLLLLTVGHFGMKTLKNDRFLGGMTLAHWPDPRSPRGAMGVMTVVESGLCGR